METPVSTPFRLISEDLLVAFPSPRRVLSSAVLGGGFTEASFILNHWVQREMPDDQKERRCEIGPRPQAYLQSRIRELGIEGRGVGLMTAVNIPKNLVALHLGFKERWVEGFFTVGVGNAVRAGDPASDIEEEKAARPVGTINMILIADAALSDAAMVEALQVATEAKAAVLLESGIRSAVSSRARRRNRNRLRGDRLRRRIAAPVCRHPHPNGGADRPGGFGGNPARGEAARETIIAKKVIF